ncbi:hypothetical protein FACS189425_04000 [Clostridia bacterium]|nr:hypothetical protein FACS189425_04000 [Clostridia bacterium]
MLDAYVDKILVQKGIRNKDYFWFMCATMVPFAAVMLFFEPMLFQFNLLIIGIILISIVIRYVRLNTVVGVCEYLSPFEFRAYAMLGLVLAFVIDTVAGLAEFNMISAIAIAFSVTGVFILADAKLRIEKVRKNLVWHILFCVAAGYAAHFALIYCSNALYILILNLALTIAFCGGYTPSYLKKQGHLLKWVVVQQFFGFIATYLSYILVQKSVTLYYAVDPLIVLLVVLAAFWLKKISRKPRMRDVLAVVLIALGTWLISF